MTPNIPAIFNQSAFALAKPSIHPPLHPSTFFHLYTLTLKDPSIHRSVQVPFFITNRFCHRRPTAPFQSSIYKFTHSHPSIFPVEDFVDEEDTSGIKVDPISLEWDPQYPKFTEDEAEKTSCKLAKFTPLHMCL